MTNENTKSVIDMNNELISSKPREIKLHKFADGEFKVPTEYYCVRCGQKKHVRQEVLIKRIEKQYGNSMSRFLKEATCSSCKKEDKIDAEIKKLEELKAKRDALKEQNA